MSKNVLATKMTNAMCKRDGYLSISDVTEATFKSYTFNTCLKVKEGGFVKWVLYWEDCPVVYVFTVLTTILSTGYVKATIIDKQGSFVDTIGAYPAKSNTVFGEIIKGVFYDKAGVHNMAVSELLKRDVPSNKQAKKKVQSELDLEQKKLQIEEAWGITSKK